MLSMIYFLIAGISLTATNINFLKMNQETPTVYVSSEDVEDRKWSLLVNEVKV